MNLQRGRGPSLSSSSLSVAMQRSLSLQRIGKTGMKVLRVCERILIAAGLVCVLAYVCDRVCATALYKVGLWSFAQLKIGSPSVNYQERCCTADVSPGAGSRAADYKQALAARISAPLAVLSIPRLRLDVPVFEGTDELTLKRGAGHIAGTARPGELGNVGIAAHRDGFFRRLKDIRSGDRIELMELQHKLTYIVDNITVVAPNDVTVLKARAQPSLTLVTCYPFYFVGAAPQRYIVQASLANPGRANSETSKLN